MALEFIQAPRRDCIASAAFAWFTVAGFVVFPGTFTSLAESQFAKSSQRGQKIGNTVQNIPLLPLGSLCCAIGVGGTIWLGYKWQRNYIFVIRQLIV